jgi:hypothetical protein
MTGNGKTRQEIRCSQKNEYNRKERIGQKDITGTHATHFKEQKQQSTKRETEEHNGQKGDI